MIKTLQNQVISEKRKKKLSGFFFCMCCLVRWQSIKFFRSLSSIVSLSQPPSCFSVYFCSELP